MAKMTEGSELMNRIFAGGFKKATPEVVESVRLLVSDACEELLDVGARVRPLLLGDSRTGWVRGLHITERKLLGRWYKGLEFVEESLLLATSLTRKEIEQMTSVEVHTLAKLVKDMTDYDMSLAPYLSAFSTTSVSEYLWYGKGTALSSFENKVIAMPDGSLMKILTPSHHAKLWSTLCSYREQNKERLDTMTNSAFIVRPWVGKGIDPFLAELKVSQRNLEVNSPMAWENIVSVRALDVNDGWGHPDDTKEGLLRELKGMLSHDKHERVMDAFMKQQVAAAKAEAERIERLQKNRGGPGVMQKGGMMILTPQEVREREKRLKKGGPSTRQTEMPEGGPPAAERIRRYE